ncbi:hypothetical protein BGX28_000537 [Mortierella sp. GBA30]|nr:hypothetical protein BGX28_000537 [Mortierella sp. GBA30]
MTDVGKEYLILWWTEWFHTDRYEGMIDDCGLPYTCRHTLDRTKYDNAKVVVFLDWDPSDLPPLKDVHKSNKAWVLNTAERPQPQAYQQKYISLFTYQFTYHFNSDFIGSYFTSGHQTPSALINLVSRPPLYTLESKNQFRRTGFSSLDSRPLAPVAWIVSNCKAISGRHYLVNQLKRYIDIDIYGHCIPNRPWPLKSGSQTEMSDEELVSHYKFYLAIENTNCEDYVTEKLERTFAAGTVPVVDGPEDYSRFTPANKSLIRYDDHGSPERLAQYLKLLDEDDALYLEYLAYRTDRTPENTDENGNLKVQFPETYNQNYRTRLLPWFVDNWDIDTSGPLNKTTTEWLSNDGETRTSRAKYGMQWGPDGGGARCALCRTAHDLTEGIITIDPTKRLAIDTTCTFYKFYYPSWIMAFYPYLTLFLFGTVGTLIYLLMTKPGRRRLQRWVQGATLAVVRLRGKRQHQYFELATTA